MGARLIFYGTVYLPHRYYGLKLMSELRYRDQNRLAISLSRHAKLPAVYIGPSYHAHSIISSVPGPIARSYKCFSS